MASIISAGTTSGTSLNLSGDTSGVLQLASNGSTTAVTINTSQNTTFAQTINAPNTFGFKNRIINGAMVIDQRNAGASVTITDTSNLTYILDRWNAYGSVASKFSVQQNAGSVTPPAGFTNYLGVTSLAATSVGSSDLFIIGQAIEGFNTADLDFGKSTAKTITIGFWVRSSLTGTFGGSVQNSATNRSYPFSYTISSANTWEQKSITVTGDTTGTWIGATNGIGLRLWLSLGMGASFSGTAGAWAGADYRSATGATSVVGTSGATFYITGVQLEVGSTATSFDYRPYGTELALCQRYYFKIKADVGFSDLATGYSPSTTSSQGLTYFPVSMRTSPTALEQSGTAANYAVLHSSGGVAVRTVCSAVPAFQIATINCARSSFTVASGLTAGQGAMQGADNNTSAFLAWSVEL